MLMSQACRSQIGDSAWNALPLNRFTSYSKCGDPKMRRWEWKERNSLCVSPLPKVCCWHPCRACHHPGDRIQVPSPELARSWNVTRTAKDFCPISKGELSFHFIWCSHFSNQAAFQENLLTGGQSCLGLPNSDVPALLAICTSTNITTLSNRCWAYAQPMSITRNDDENPKSVFCLLGSISKFIVLAERRLASVKLKNHVG